MTPWLLDVTFAMSLGMFVMIVVGLIVDPFEKKKPGAGTPGQRNRK